mgnify:CR=1 FL=1
MQILCGSIHNNCCYTSLYLCYAGHCCKPNWQREARLVSWIYLCFAPRFLLQSLCSCCYRCCLQKVYWRKTPKAFDNETLVHNSSAKRARWSSCKIFSKLSSYFRLILLELKDPKLLPILSQTEEVSQILNMQKPIIRDRLQELLILMTPPKNPRKILL